MIFRVRNITRDTLLAGEVQRARSLWQRMKGLLGEKVLPEGHGLWIERCKSIHTHFMRFPIDVIFVSRSGQVVRTYENLKPFRMTRFLLQAQSVLELPAGTLAKKSTHEGDQLSLEAHT